MRSLRVLSAIHVVLFFAGFALASQPAPADPVDPAAPVAVVEPASPAAAVAPVAPLAPVDAADACELNYTPADPEAALLVASNCKPCKGVTFCKCTYNGLPRVSCDPCCYGNLGIPQVCLS